MVLKGMSDRIDRDKFDSAFGRIRGVDQTITQRKPQVGDATGADGGGSAKKTGMVSIMTDAVETFKSSFGGGGGGKKDDTAATVEEMSREVTNEVMKSTDQLQFFIAKLCENVMKKSTEGAVAVWASYLEAYKNQKSSPKVVSTAPIDMLEICEYESEDDSHLFAEETQQQLEAPADTPVE